MKPVKIVINVIYGILMLLFFVLMFFDLEKNIFFYLVINILWLMFNIEHYYKNIIEEKPNISTRQMKLAKIPYITSIVCLVAVVIIEFTLNIEIKYSVLTKITLLNLLSNIYGYFLFKHLNKVAMALE